MHYKRLILIGIGILLIWDFADGKPSAANDDEYLDELLQEFQEADKDEGSVKKTRGETETAAANNLIPLNAQPKFFKNEKCNCTRFFMCDVEYKPTSQEESASAEEGDGADLDLINIRLNVPEGGCPHYLDICCEKLKKTNPIQIPKIPHPVCGKRNDHGVGFRIVGGKDSEAQFGEFPWMTAVTEAKQAKIPGAKPLKVFVCGGSLIHPQVVLTAAHCLRNKTASTLQVRVGEWDTQTDDELYRYEEVDVDKIIFHPNFIMKRNLINDIALLVLTKEVKLAPNVAPICLPDSSVKMDGAKCFATGWGKDEFGAQGAYQTILKKVELPIVPQKACQTQLRQTKLGTRFHLHESFVCAGGEAGKDTCKGDGGSPLVCQLPGADIYVQYGIVSWGLGCGGNIPGVYVNVPLFSPWIEETLDSLGLGKEEKYRFSNPR